MTVNTHIYFFWPERLSIYTLTKIKIRNSTCTFIAVLHLIFNSEEKMNVKLPEPAADEQHSLLLHLALLWISQVHVHRGCGMSLLSALVELIFYH